MDQPRWAGGGPSSQVLHRRSNIGDRSPVNPVIILRRYTVDSSNGGGFKMYYDAGGEAGLSLVPVSMPGSLSSLGFERLDIIEQNLPATKAAIEALPTIMIKEAHVSKQSHSGRR
ncbi:hypothetical protein R6Q57_018377 [Mikania cordata]